MDANRHKRASLDKKLSQHAKAQKPDVAAIQQEMQMFDRDLAQQEADHMTYKRNSVAMANTVQWDAMLELAAKMQIIATFGKYLTVGIFVPDCYQCSSCVLWDLNLVVWPLGLRS